MAKRVLITGASGGIGSGIAKKFSAEKYNIVCPKRADLDLQDPCSIEHFFEKDNGFDILINNAGINQISEFNHYDNETIYATMNVNLLAPSLLAKYVLPHMITKKWGRIINISSIYSKISRPSRVLYTTTKAGINGLTIGLANEYADRNILVNAVLPGFVDTKLTRKNNTHEQIEQLCKNRIPLGRLATVEEISDLVFMLASEKNTYITGQAIAIDGGVLTA